MRTSKKIISKELSFFTRKLATLVAAGIPLLQALNTLAQSYERGTMHNLVKNLKRDLERGHSFSATLKKYPQNFNHFYCALIEIAELSGSLDILLLRLASDQEKHELLKRELKSALIYPLIIFVVAIAVSSFLLIYVVPTFKEMFESFKVELPLSTKTLLGLSAFLKEKGCYLLITLAVVSFFLIKLIKRNKNLQHFIQKKSLQIPIFGALLSKHHIAAITRMLAITEAAGVPLNKALQNMLGLIPNIVFVQALNQIKLMLERGQRLQVAMQASKIFPPLVCQMVAIGEETGTLDKILERLSNILDEEFEVAVNQLSILVEPLLMLFLGLMVGGLVIALYLPVFNMGSLF